MPGNLDRILEGEKDSGLGPLLRLHVEEILALVEHRAVRHRVGRVAGEHLCQRALAGAVWTHDGMNLTGVDGEIDALEDFLVSGAGPEAFDFQHSRTPRCAAP